MNAVRVEVLELMRGHLSDLMGDEMAGFLASLPYALKALLIRDSFDDAWIGSREFSMLLAAIDLQPRPQLSNFCLDFGRLFIETHAQHFPFVSPENASLSSLFGHSRQAAVLTLARQLGSDLERLQEWFRPLEAAVDERISLQQLHFHVAARPVHLPAFCEMMLGMAAGFLEIRHVPYVHIQEISCRLGGYGICTFAVVLEPENPLSFL